MAHWLYRWLDRIFAAAGAFLMSQFPQFYDQYLQRAMGHIEELSRQIDLMRQTANLSGKTLEAYIKKFQTSDDLDILHQGNLMQQMTERASDLAEGITAMTQADVLTRPFAFLGHVQSDIAASTLQHFKPGFTFGVEGVVYALLGIFLGYGVFHIFTRCLVGFWTVVTRPFRGTKNESQQTKEKST